MPRPFSRPQLSHIDSSTHRIDQEELSVEIRNWVTRYLSRSSFEKEPALQISALDMILVAICRNEHRRASRTG